MNDLDKRIAELKGWISFSEYRKEWIAVPPPGSEPPTRYDDDSEPAAYYKSDRYPGEFFSQDASYMDGWPKGTFFHIPSWATSDAKALELVDELGRGLRLEGCGFHWSAVIDFFGQHHQETGTTRPEAICRAYIAAREWAASRPASDRYGGTG